MECVINLSEGRDTARLRTLRSAAGGCLLDAHSDPHHNRTVLTLAGDESRLWSAATSVARAAVSCLDLRAHHGAHPRIGVLDVVPWVDLDHPSAPFTPASLQARDRFATWAAEELCLPCFIYGPERSLPEIRRRAWRGLEPTIGPGRPHPTAGAVAVGARGVLVAYNLWLSDPDPVRARRIAKAVRRLSLRTLGLRVGQRAQVSCNLVDPSELGPAAAYDLVASETAVAGAELVGVLPESVLHSIPARRWAQLDVGPGRTIEARLRRNGIDDLASSRDCCDC